MTQEDLASRIENVFARVLGPHVSFHPMLSRVNEARWTSLKHVELLIALEDEFHVRFDGGDATEITSVAVIVEKVRHKLS